MLVEMTSEHLLKPLLTWLNDENISEIILNQPGVIFVECYNTFYRYEVPEFNIQRLNQLFRLLANENQQELNEKKPLLSGKLKDGSRIQLVIPPITPSQAFSIRLHRFKQPNLDQLYNKGYFNSTTEFDINNHHFKIQDKNTNRLLQYYKKSQWYNFVKLALQSKKNIVISGGTSTGKTTFLNACLNELPLSERLIILEDTPEISVKHENSLRLLTYKEQQGLSDLSMQDLVQCSLRLRPDRIIVGEVRGKEIFDYVGASLTGHRGTITTIHADNPRIALIRMCQMYKLNNLPAMSDQDIYREIKQAVDIIFQLNRTDSGRYLQSVFWQQESKK